MKPGDLTLFFAGACAILGVEMAYFGLAKYAYVQFGLMLVNLALTVYERTRK